MKTLARGLVTIAVRSWTQTQNECRGDSGGPLLDLSRGAVLGTKSGYVGPDDRFGDVPLNFAIVESIANRWQRR